MGRDAMINAGIAWSIVVMKPRRSKTPSVHGMDFSEQSEPRFSPTQCKISFVDSHKFLIQQASIDYLFTPRIMSDQQPSGSHPPTWEGKRLQPNNDAALREVLKLACDYRGDVTIHLKTGEHVIGYAFDHQEGIPSPYIKLFLANQSEPSFVKCQDIAEVEFSGEDTAFGRSWEDWAQKWQKPQAS